MGDTTALSVVINSISVVLAFSSACLNHRIEDTRFGAKTGELGVSVMDGLLVHIQQNWGKGLRAGGGWGEMSTQDLEFKPRRFISHLNAKIPPIHKVT